MSQPRPLEGLRVVELGQLLAGPFAGTVLGYFGAAIYDHLVYLPVSICA